MTNASRALTARWNRLKYLVSFLGPLGTAKRVGAKLLSPIYYREDLVVTNTYYESDPKVAKESGPGAIDWEVYTSVGEIEERRGQIHPDLDVDYLIEFLQRGTDKAFVSLLSYENEDGSITYIGIGANDIGWYRMEPYGLEGPLSDDVLVGYAWEIAPEFRGRGYSNGGRYGWVKHRQKMGARMSTGFVRKHNLPSLKSSVRQVEGNVKTINGVFSITQWFGGLWVRKPPWEEVRAMLESPPGTTTIPR